MGLRGFGTGIATTFCLMWSLGMVQAQDLGVPLSPVLVINSDQVFLSSQAGQKIDADLEDKLQALVTENRAIESDLSAEELDLTRKRDGMDPAEFRTLANAFDEKVQKIRAAQDAKQRDLQQFRDQENQSFIQTITPILSDISRERGALLVLERRNVILSADTIDITQEAIDRINKAMQNQSSPAGDTIDKSPVVPEDNQSPQ